MIRVKVCGITRRADAEAAIEAGADMLGFNFYRPSPRYVEPSQVRGILSGLERAVATAGVFVNETAEHIDEYMEACGAGLVQLHGDESPEFCASLGRPVIMAIRVGSESDLSGIEDYKVWAVLVDSRTEGFGGSGKAPDWDLARKVRESCDRVILAGGLTPDNVAEAIAAVEPWGVDVATGVESAPGIKDHEKIKLFIKAVRDASG